MAKCSPVMDQVFPYTRVPKYIRAPTPKRPPTPPAPPHTHNQTDTHPTFNPPQTWFQVFMQLLGLLLLGYTSVVTWRVDKLVAVGLQGCVWLPRRAKDFPKVSALGVLVNSMGINFARGNLCLVTRMRARAWLGTEVRIGITNQEVRKNQKSMKLMPRNTLKH